MAGIVQNVGLHNTFTVAECWAVSDVCDGRMTSVRQLSDGSINPITRQRAPGLYREVRGREAECGAALAGGDDLAYMAKNRPSMRVACPTSPLESALRMAVLLTTSLSMIKGGTLST